MEELLKHGIEMITDYVSDTDTDAYISDIELGSNILCGISDNYAENMKNSELFKMFTSLLIQLCQKEIADEKRGGFVLLCDIFCPGRELYPDEKKYPWWWLPEKIIVHIGDEEQLKRWKKYVKSRGY